MNKTTLKIMTLRKIIFFLICLLVSINSYSQTPKFTTPTLISGTNKQVGAKYLYPIVTTVDGSNVDAIVTIVSISNASIVDVDNPTNGGLIDRFQPVVNTSNPNGYVEYEFSFYKSGTYATAQELKIDLGSFILEVLDLDGNEFFDVARPNNESYTLESNTFLTVTTVGIYTRFQGPSNSVDPISITNTRYIAAVNFGALNSIKFRLGNSGTSSNRQSSISFGEVSFIIPKAPIANNDFSLCKPYGVVSLDVTLNDTDSNQNIDKSKVDLNVSSTGVQNSLVVSGEGTWSVNSVGIVTFSPLVTFNANPTPIYYRINDLTSLTSDQAQITITYTPTVPTVSVVNNCNGTSTLNASNYTGSLLWNTGATTASIIVSTAGTFTVAQTLNGCTSANGSGVAAPKTTPTTLSLTGSTICALPGGNGTITSSTSVSGTTYQLYNASNVAVQGSITGTGSGLSWSGLAAGSGYYVVATNAATCTSTSATVDVATTPNPIALSLTGSTICVLPGGNGTITSSTSVSGTTYQLFNASNVAVQASISGTGSGLSWSGLATGNGYYVVATNAASCTTTIATVNVATMPNPNTPAVSVSSQPSCEVPVGSVFLSGLPTGNWIINPGNINGNTSTKTISGLTPGTYNFTVTNSSGCISSSTSNIVISNVICANDDTGANVNGFTGGTSFTNVLSNDTLNGALVDPTKVTTTLYQQPIQESLYQERM